MASGSQLPGTPPPGARPFRFETSREHDSATVLPIGELDIATVPVLKAELEALRSAGIRRLIVDLSSLEFIDSTGLRCLLSYDAEARQDGFTLALIPGSRAVQRIFDLTSTTSLLPFIEPDRPRRPDR